MQVSENPILQDKYNAALCFHNGYRMLDDFAQYRKNIVKYCTIPEEVEPLKTGTNVLMDAIHEKMPHFSNKHAAVGYKKNKSYIDFSLSLENHGELPLFDYEIVLFFEGETREVKLKKNLYPIEDKGNSNITFLEGSKYIKLVPDESTLSPGAKVTFAELSIRSPLETTIIHINWRLVSECHSFSGTLALAAIPILHEYKRVVLVDDERLVRTEEIIEDYFEEPE